MPVTLRVFLTLAVAASSLVLPSFSHAQACTPWPDGAELVFCGRGGQPCPSGFACSIAPDDSYAVCLPQEESGYCPNPPDLTGTWEGRFACTSVSQGAKLKTANKAATLKITHIPNSPLQAEIDGYIFSGTAAALAKAPTKGAVSFAYCKTSAEDVNTFDQISSGNFNVAANRSTIRGKSTWNLGNALTGHPLAATGGNCRFSYKRVDTANPGVPSCSQCCDPAEQPGGSGNPLCFMGHDCCATGQWQCRDGAGDSTCVKVSQGCAP